MYGLIALIGITSLFAPFVFGYSDNSAALWTNLTVGFVLTSVSLFERLARDKENWEYWVVGGIGCVAVLAPFVLGFSRQGEAFLATFILGVTAVVISAYKLYLGKPPRISI